MKVLAPGIGAAVRAHLAAHGMTRAALAAEVGLSVPQLGRVSAGNGVIAETTFTALAAVLACPYTVDHCKLSERPGGPVRQSSPVDDRNYSFRRKAWPALDDFAGLPGGWC